MARKTLGTCSIHGCEKKEWQRGWCTAHYARWRRHGEPVKLLRMENGAGLRLIEDASKSDAAACILFPSKNPDRYQTIWFRRQSVGAHVASCTLRHGEKPFVDAEVAHNCGVKTCVNGSHLRWSAHVDNERDKVAHGSIPRGEKAGACKFTAEEIVAVRAELAKGRKQKDIAHQFGMSEMNVSSIKLRKIWGWME